MLNVNVNVNDNVIVNANGNADGQRQPFYDMLQQELHIVPFMSDQIEIVAEQPFARYDRTFVRHPQKIKEDIPLAKGYFWGIDEDKEMKAKLIKQLETTEAEIGKHVVIQDAVRIYGDVNFRQPFLDLTPFERFKTPLHLLEGTDGTRFYPYKVDFSPNYNTHYNLRGGREFLEKTALCSAAGVDHSNALQGFDVFEMGCSVRLAALIGRFNGLKLNRPFIDNADVDRGYKLIEKMRQVYNRIVYEQRRQMEENHMRGDIPTFQEYVRSTVCCCKQGSSPCMHITRGSIVVMTHVAYYLDPNMMLKLLKNGCVLSVVCHVFDPKAKSGTYNDGINLEASWKRLDDGRISFHVTNDKTYKHKDILNFLYLVDSYDIGPISYTVVGRLRYGNFDQIGVVIRLNPLRKAEATSFVLNMGVEQLEGLYQDLDLGVSEEFCIMNKDITLSDAISHATKHNEFCVVSKPEDKGQEKLVLKRIEGQVQFAKFKNEHLSIWSFLSDNQARYRSRFLADYIGSQYFEKKNFAFQVPLETYNSVVADCLSDELNEETIYFNIFRALKGNFRYCQDPAVTLLFTQFVLYDVMRLKSGVKKILNSGLSQQWKNIEQSGGEKSLIGMIKEHLIEKVVPSKAINLDDQKKSVDIVPRPVNKEIAEHSENEKSYDEISILCRDLTDALNGKQKVIPFDDKTAMPESLKEKNQLLLQGLNQLQGDKKCALISFEPVFAEMRELCNLPQKKYLSLEEYAKDVRQTLPVFVENELMSNEAKEMFIPMTEKINWSPTTKQLLKLYDMLEIPVNLYRYISYKGKTYLSCPKEVNPEAYDVIVFKGHVEAFLPSTRFEDQSPIVITKPESLNYEDGSYTEPF